MWQCFLDSNNFSIGIHSFKVLVQIHYSQSPCPAFWLKFKGIPFILIKIATVGDVWATIRPYFVNISSFSLPKVVVRPAVVRLCQLSRKQNQCKRAKRASIDSGFDTAGATLRQLAEVWQYSVGQILELSRINWPSNCKNISVRSYFLIFGKSSTKQAI